MNVTFYKFTKRRNSTAQPTGGALYTGTLRDESGIISPTLIMSFGNTTAPDYNYAYISDFGRYYWISEITAIGGGFWRVSMDVDVLASYKTQIGASSKYVARAASAFNGNIVDVKYPAKVDPLIPTAASVAVLTGGAPWTGMFMMGVITPYGANGGITIFVLTAQQLQTVRSTLMGNDNYWSQITDIDLRNLAICLSDPLQYITWCRYYPFTLPSGSTTPTTMTLGKVTFQDMPMLNADKTLWEFGLDPISIPKHPQYQARGEWLNSDPYTSYYIDWQPIGKVQLPTQMLHGVTNLYPLMKIDFLTGMGRLAFVPSLQTAGNIIYSTDFMIGADVPMSQIMSSNPVGLLSTIISAAGAAGSFVSSNIPGAIAGSVSAIGSAFDAAKPNVQSLNASKGTLLSSGEYLHFISVFHRMADDHNDEFGRPLCEVRQLSTLSGYIQCEDGEVAAPATENELRELEGFLTGGFYYE